jgi:hypothetical protein
MARFSSYQFDRGISAHHFLAAEVTRQLVE